MNFMDELPTHRIRLEGDDVSGEVDFRLPNAAELQGFRRAWRGGAKVRSVDEIYTLCKVSARGEPPAEYRALRTLYRTRAVTALLDLIGQQMRKEGMDGR